MVYFIMPTFLVPGDLAISAITQICEGDGQVFFLCLQIFNFCAEVKSKEKDKKNITKCEEFVALIKTEN